MWFGKSNAALTGEYLNIIKQTISKEREVHSFVNLLKRLGLVALIIVLLVIVVWFVNIVFRRFTGFISLNEDKYLLFYLSK
ncbi:hypothetical protein [Chitinophaga sancti]|uniref:Uncharacterized protein n=1 Tax=Chitinophaga sancti TaxID=1004 RepID=A0A1K1RVN5_9BACT|nr:hypothetical protein [Chitinophaga sancti]WQD62331.1 hypothetical protein U0033_31045 [Chitinophaga sancti]WQG92100.1 hypothetical protein SR876_11340 [Chitinophaga sancti]SFW75892.1 hypothetical protein SAMN05661012_04308 [Chitinophaga sancti]